MQRTPCAAAAVLAFMSVARAAEAHPPILYRTYCVGAFCWPVAVPAPDRATPRNATQRRHRGPRPSAARGLRDDARAEAGAPIAGDSTIAVARRYLGRNPTGWARAWCGAFMRLVMRGAGYPDLPSGNVASAWTHYGRPGLPQPGALVVWPHHVGLITAVYGDVRATVISGNDGRRVRERELSIAHAVVRLPR